MSNDFSNVEVNPALARIVGNLCRVIIFLPGLAQAVHSKRNSGLYPNNSHTSKYHLSFVNIKRHGHVSRQYLAHQNEMISTQLV